MIPTSRIQHSQVQPLPAHALPQASHTWEHYRCRGRNSAHRRSLCPCPPAWLCQGSQPLRVGILESRNAGAARGPQKPEVHLTLDGELARDYGAASRCFGLQVEVRSFHPRSFQLSWFCGGQWLGLVPVCCPGLFQGSAWGETARVWSKNGMSLFCVPGIILSVLFYFK